MERPGFRRSRLEIRLWRGRAAVEIFLVSEDSRESEIPIGKVAMKSGDLGLDRQSVGGYGVGRSRQEIGLWSRCIICVSLS
jgi:hypothetical protein